MTEAMDFPFGLRSATAYDRAVGKDAIHADALKGKSGGDQVKGYFTKRMTWAHPALRIRAVVV